MSKIKDEIARLEHIDELIEFANTLIEDETLCLKKSLKGGKPEVLKAIRAFLVGYIKSLEKGLDFAPILSFSNEELEALKMMAEKVTSSVKKSDIVKATEPVIIDSGIKPGVTIIPYQTVPNTSASITSSKSKFPLRAKLADVNYIFDQHGPKVQGVSPDMEITISKEIDEDYYEAYLPNQRSIVFNVPKDVVELF